MLSALNAHRNILRKYNEIAMNATFKGPSPP